nr:hypothetical protein [Tanacetum cinerariifolium]
VNRSPSEKSDLNSLETRRRHGMKRSEIYGKPEIQRYMSTYPELTTIDKADVVDWVFEKNVRPFFRVLKGKNGMLQKVIPDFESSGKR